MSNAVGLGLTQLCCDPQQVVPAAEEITQNRIQPAAKMVAEQAVPTAKEFTEGQLKPAAQAVADNVRLSC